MTSYNLKQMLSIAREKKYAVGAFNIFNYVSAKASIKAAEELKSPIILQTSTSTVKLFGVKPMIEMLRLLTKEAAIPVIIHLDHCTDASLAKACIDAKWDSVMIDASSKPLEENINITLDIKKYAEKNNVDVEGELGIIKGVEENIVSDIAKTADYAESMRYLKETGIDAFAPAIGTAHGLYKGDPVINFDLVERLCASTDCPVVIHGGTGLTEETFKQLINNGASKVNISTALKHAYFDSCQSYFQLNPKDRNPLKLDEYIEAQIKEVVKKHILIFNSDNKV